VPLSDLFDTDSSSRRARSSITPDPPSPAAQLTSSNRPVARPGKADSAMPDVGSSGTPSSDVPVAAQALAAVYPSPLTGIQQLQVGGRSTSDGRFITAAVLLAAQAAPRETGGLAGASGTAAAAHTADRPSATTTSPAAVPETADIAVQLERQQTMSRAAVRDAAGTDAGRVAAMRAFLRYFRDHCPVCFALGRGPWQHDPADCPEQATWTAMQPGVARLRDTFFRYGGFKDFSACFFCGVPQDLCNRAWKMGAQERRRTDCEYKNVIVHTVAAFTHVRTDLAPRLYALFARTQGKSGTLTVHVYPVWLGFLQRYGGIQASFLAILYCSICKALQVDTEVVGLVGVPGAEDLGEGEGTTADPEAEAWLL
jgi:hypothetical protein